MAYEDPDDKLTIPVTKLQWGLKGAQIFFAFLAMACIASVIAFDNRTTSSTIIDNIFIFFVILSMFMSAAIVGIPYSYIEYGKFENLARALRIVRIEFVLTAIWAILIFLVSVAVSVEMGVKNCDPFAPEYAFALNRTTNETFIDGLSGRCRTARAANAFGWFALVVWLGSLALVGKEWYESRRQPLPKHDFHRDEITMNSSSSKSSLDASGSGGFRPPQGSQSPHQENVQMENIHTFAANLSQPQIQQPQPQQPQPQTQFQPPSPQHTPQPQPQPQTQFQSPQPQPQTQFQSPPLQLQTQFQSPPLQPQTQFQSPPLQPQTQFQSPIQPQVQFQSPPLQPQVQQIQQPQVQNQPPIQQPQVQQIQQQQQQPQIYQSPPQSYQQVPPNTGGAPIPTNSNILPVNPANAPNPNVEFPQPQHFS